MPTIDIPTRPMSAREFHTWAQAQPDGRFELIDGRVVLMSPERVGHSVAKAEVWRRLSDAIRAAGLACETFVDGPSVAVSDDTCYVPDVVVQCGPRADRDAVELEAPLIVVEVTSPSSARVDTIGKLSDYFRIASLEHYLVVDLRNRKVVHFRRAAGGTLDTRLAATGMLRFDPPGFAIAVDGLFD